MDDEERLRALLGSGAIPGVDAPAAIRLIGTGESYRAWRITTDATDLVIRIPTRPVAALPQPMACEFAALQHVPAELGSHGICFDDTANNVLGEPYLVTTYVPGRVLHSDEWSEATMLAHAQSLARLHHAFSQLPSTGTVIPTVAAEAEQGLAWWRNSRPDLVAHSSVAPLIEPWLTRLHEFDWAATGVAQLPQIHGDLALTNIVVDEADVPRYIDWEWGGPGDSAKDLALFGGAIHTDPWYLQMNADQIDTFVRTYHQHGDQTEDLAALLARRDAWELAERLQMALHLLGKAAEPNRDHVMAEQLLAGVAAVLAAPRTMPG